MRVEQIEVHAATVCRHLGYDTQVLSCVPSTPAVVGARVSSGYLIVEIVPLPGRRLPDTVTVHLAQ
jgi:hypothetical protein